MNRLVWILYLICFSLYGALFPFKNIGVAFFTETKFNNMDKTEAQMIASRYNSIPFVIATFLMPCVGYIVDKIGHRVHFLTASSLMAMIMFVLFNFNFIHPLFPLILFGITYSIYAGVIWPSLSITAIKERVVN